jgi:hypothetical protein
MEKWFQAFAPSWALPAWSLLSHVFAPGTAKIPAFTSIIDQKNNFLNAGGENNGS